MARAMTNKLSIHALKVSQWLSEWDDVEFRANQHRKKPDDHFYIFSLSAKQLRMLSGVNRRQAKSNRGNVEELGIQRGHEVNRSRNISEYIKYGYPWSDLSKNQRKDKKFSDLKKPGWLPTAIVVNILKKGDKRNGKSVIDGDLVTVKELDGNLCEILLPNVNKKGWRASGNLPIEVIDGQHRLLAFDEGIDQDYELPVVAFFGLDVSWQAYLFWSINIKPKRINPSLAFDLYPLLRTEDWLERFEGHKVYREVRAQDLVETLWSEPSSSWHHRINMLGESGTGHVTQAAWIRALLKTYIKSFEGRGVTIGGLFGAPVGEDKTVLPWNRSQQSAVLIFLWNAIRDAIKKSNHSWARKLRDAKYKRKIVGDPAFEGPHSLLNTDQGITVVLNVTNDLLFFNVDELQLQDWQLSPEVDVSDALSNLKRSQKRLKEYILGISECLTSYDWRTSGADNLSETERTEKLALRGGSGYREFRRQILKHMFKCKIVSGDAKYIYASLGFDED